MIKRRTYRLRTDHSFQNIAFPLHILWRLDALLFNLGLTLIVSAYYYNIEPIYTRHPHQRNVRHALEAAARHHRLLPLIVFAVISIHLVVSIAWALGVRRAGIGAVTWGVRFDDTDTFQRRLTIAPPLHAEPDNITGFSLCWAWSVSLGNSVL